MKLPELRIRTPEGITFAYELAGPVMRSLAWLVDQVVLLTLLFGVSFGLGTLGRFMVDFAEALLVASWFILSVGYGVVAEWYWRGQTVGKKFLRLRVMDADGFALQFHQVVMRNLLRFFDCLPVAYLVGGLACLITRKKQRLGDLAAGTIVVFHRKAQEPDLAQLLGNKYNSLREHPHLCARLRQRISPEEARLALQTLIRRDDFEDRERIQVFAAFAQHLGKQVNFPAEVSEGMPDEQFVRNVVDVLFRTHAPRATEANPA